MKNRSVLVVEDNPMNRELVTELLEMEGYSVLLAENAELGIEMAKAHHPDVILMDMSLPGMDGLSATRELKKDPIMSSIPVVALTAHAMLADADRVRDAGCVAYMTKPLDADSFSKTVRSVLENGGHHTP